MVEDIPLVEGASAQDKGESLLPRDPSILGDRVVSGGASIRERGESLQPSPALNAPSSANKLDRAQQLLICQALAEFCTLQEAADRLQAAGGPSLSPNGVLHYRDSPDWQPLIAELRAAWTARLADVPFAHKIVRLERLERLYKSNIAKGFRRDALACVEAARKEVEGPDRAGSASSEIRITLGNQAQPIEATLVASSVPEAIPALGEGVDLDHGEPRSE